MNIHGTKLFQYVFNKHGKPAVGTAGEGPLLDDKKERLIEHPGINNIYIYINKKIIIKKAPRQI